MSKGFDILLESLLQISLTTAVVIGILLMLIPVWRQRYSARWRKVIWLVIAVRLLVPFSIELPAAPVQMSVDWKHEVMGTVPEESMNDPMKLDEQNAAVQNDTAILPKENTTPLMEQQAAANGLAVFDGILYRDMVWLAVWLVGSLLFVLWHGGNYAVFRRKVMRFAVPFADTEGVLQQAAQDFSIRRYPAVVMSRNAQGPMLIGFCKPVIVLPERNYDAQELALILRHELVHYKQHDLWYKLILLAANAVHWFNPMVWLMVRQANKDIEQVCDDVVVAGKDIDYRKAYSMTLLNAMASKGGIAMSTYLSKDAQDVKKRFSDILNPKQHKRGFIVLLMVMLATLFASGCLEIQEPFAGAEQLEQFEQYLPQGLEFGDQLKYEESIAENTNMYSWIDYADETEIVNNVIGGVGNNGCNIVVITDKEETVTTYSVTINSGYRVQEKLPQNPLSDEEAKKLAESFMKDISGETNLQLQDWQPVPILPYRQDGLYMNEMGWLADSADKDYHYEIVVDTKNGYVQFFRKYFDNEQQREQMTSWLEAKAREVFLSYPRIVKVEEDSFTTYCWREKQNYWMNIALETIYYGHENDRDADSIWGKAAASGATAEHLNLRFYVQACAPVREDGTLDMENCRLFISDVDQSGKTYLREVDGFDVFVGKSINALPSSVSRTSTEMLKVAEDFTNRFVTLTNNKDENWRDKVLEHDTILKLGLPEYSYDVENTQSSGSLYADFKRRYCQFGNDKESYEPVEVTAELLTDDESMDYLTLEMETVDGEWKVTEAWLEK